MPNLLILGDLAPVGHAKLPFLKGDMDWFTKGLEPYWSGSDYRIVNLECPLIAKPDPIRKDGVCLGLETENADALRQFSLVGLANNHILDHGSNGLMHTTNVLDKAGIPHIGAGININEAGRSHVVEIGDIRVGFLAWSHHEFCIATEAEAGAHPIDLSLGLPIIESIRDRCDFLILLYHGGVEHFPYPTPEQRKICRFLASRGVDLIVCQHSHIVGAVDEFGPSTIVYGQGNYSLDLTSGSFPESFYRGLMLSVKLDKNQGLKVESIPIVQEPKMNMRPVLAGPDLASEILEQQQSCTRILHDSDAYARVWRDSAKLAAYRYLFGLIPLGGGINLVLRRLGVLDSPFLRNVFIRILNLVQCEAHADVLRSGLKEPGK